MSISLITTLLPLEGTAERKVIDQILTLDTDAQPKKLVPQYQRCIRLARLLLTIAKEAADSLVELKYKSYDALVKNFGCQITALELQQILRKKEELYQEAHDVQDLINDCLARGRTFQAKPPLGEKGVQGIDYLISNKLDIQLSQRMSRLVQLRLLSIVNSNRAHGNREVPYTCTDNLKRKLEKTNAIPIKELVEGLQYKESKTSAAYIKDQAQYLVKRGVRRGELIARLVSEKFWRTALPSGIVSVPLVYNTEACIRLIAGVVLIKNKLKLVDQPIAGAETNRAFIRMPGEQALTAEDVRKLPNDEPLIVIECYIKNGTDIISKINAIGLVNIVTINCAVLPQYASGTSQQDLDDVEAMEDLHRWKKERAIVETIEVEHIYCASVKEEVDQ